MQPSNLQYLPISPLYFSALIGLFVIVLLLIQVGAIRYAYLRLGVSSGAALALLLGSLIGSYFNVPIAQIPGERVLSGREVYFFGMRYVVPVVVHWPGTVVAVNVGGAIIPTIMSAYLLLKHQLWASGSVAVAILTIACYLIAQPVPGIGIALPVFVPALVTGIVAVLPWTVASGNPGAVSGHVRIIGGGAFAPHASCCAAAQLSWSFRSGCGA